MIEDMEKLITEVLSTYQTDVADIEYRKVQGTNKKMLLVSDWDDIREINDRLGEVLLEAGEITSEDLENSKKEQYRVHFLDKVGLDYGFSDEYFVCDCCYEIIPREAHGKNEMFVVDGDYYCSACLNEDPCWYVEKLLEQTDPNLRINEVLSDAALKKQGFSKLEDVDMDRDLSVIYEELKERFKYAYKSVIFSNPDDLEAWVR